MNQQANIDSMKSSIATMKTMISDLERTINRMDIEYKPETNSVVKSKNGEMSGPDALMKVFKGTIVDKNG